jgi:hypothetical protein
VKSIVGTRMMINVRESVSVNESESESVTSDVDADDDDEAIEIVTLEAICLPKLGVTKVVVVVVVI